MIPDNKDFSLNIRCFNDHIYLSYNALTAMIFLP